MRALAIAAVLVASMIEPAHALRDHLTCYRIKDPLYVTSKPRLHTSLSDDSSCKASKTAYLCDPADPTITNASVPLDPVAGRGLLDARICYRVHCKSPSPTQATIADEFGARTLGKPRPRLVCTSAVMGPPAPLMDDLYEIECYRVEDALALRATAAVDTLDLGARTGCTVGRGKLVCLPTEASFIGVNVSPQLPITGRGQDDPRACYTLRCPKPYPGPQLASDRFGSRTFQGLVPKLLCAPSPLPTTTSTTLVRTSTTTTSTVPAADAALNCQRAIEWGGMYYANDVLDRIAACGASTSPATSIATCMGFTQSTQPLANSRAQWGIDTAAPCSGVDLRKDLGYNEICGAPPSNCTWPSAVLDSPYGGDDLLDCLACRIKEQLQTAAQAMYAGQRAIEPCRDAIGNGALAVVRSTINAAHACLNDPAANSVASCWTPDFSAWRPRAESTCAGIDPFGTLGYPAFCSGTPAVAPDSYAVHAFPCSFNQSTTSIAGTDNDLLDCATCQANEGALGVARDLFGTNLCCVGGHCDKVLTRYACRRDGGTPMRFRITTMTATDAGHAHGMATGPDGSLYIGYGLLLRRITPAGVVSDVATASAFPRGLAVDGAGNVYTTDSCRYTITRHVPGGGSTVIAGIPNTPGSSGDDGPATSATITLPDGIDVDAAGNVYFTESGLLGYPCSGTILPSERVRMIDTSGIIHTVAGGSAGGTANEGGLATLAQLSMPYGLRLGPDGSLYVGEAIGMRVLRVKDGMLTRTAGEPVTLIGSHSGFGGPAVRARFYENCGIATDPDGNVLIAMMEDNRIALVDSLGSVINVAGTGEGPGGTPGLGDGALGIFERVQTPEDVAVAPDGTIYVSDLGTNTIRVITKEAY